MQRLSLVLAALGLSLPAFAQCATPSGGTIGNPQNAGWYWGGTGAYALYMDINVVSDVNLTGLRTVTYDQGVGNPVVPNQVGNTTQVDIYTCPTTRRGNETNVAAWTLAGSGTMTVTAYPAWSPTVLTTPILLPAGSHGVAIVVNPTTAGTNPGPLHFLGANSTVRTTSNIYMTITNEGDQLTAFSTAAFDDDQNFEIDYVPVGQPAFYETVGAGCYNLPIGYGEQFAAPSTPDLSNTSTSLLFVPGQNPANNVYMVVGNSGVPYVTPSGTPLNNSAAAVIGFGPHDDVLYAPITLPFTLPFPGGSTNEITIGSNGRIFLGNVAAVDRTPGFYSSMNMLRTQEPCICPMFGDLDIDPTLGGALYYETDNATYARVTFANVPEWNQTNTSTFQVTFQTTGQVDIVYGNLTVNAAEVFVGMAAGNGRANGAAIDVSAAVGYLTGDGMTAPTIEMNPRPVTGTTASINVTNLNGALAGFTLLSMSGIPGGQSLAGFGLPGCTMWQSPDVVLFGLASGTPATLSAPWAIPAGPAFLGVRIFAQGATLLGGYNPAGFLVSNGICAVIGSS